MKIFKRICELHKMENWSDLKRLDIISIKLKEIVTTVTELHAYS